MRILIVVEPGIDGVFRHVEGLIGYLLEQKQEVHLAYSDRRGSERLQLLVARVKEHGGECLNLGVCNAPEIGDFSALWRLRALVRRVRAEVVHAHSSKAGVLGRTLALTGIRSRFFYSSHAYYGMAPRPGLAVHFYNILERCFGRIGTTFNVSKDEAAFATGTLKIPSRKIRIVNNPVDTAVFTRATHEERQRQRKQLGIPENAVVLGTLARLTYQKDPQTLYRAIAPVLRARKDLVLCHVGMGDLEGELNTMTRELGIAGQVMRPAYINEPARFYHALDGCIVTSRYEAGWPIVVLEALAADIPVIVGDGPGTTDIGMAGLSHCWTAPPENVKKFTSAIESWLADLPRRRPSNHRETAVAHFSPAKTFGAVLDAYRHPG